MKANRWWGRLTSFVAAGALVAAGSLLSPTSAQAAGTVPIADPNLAACLAKKLNLPSATASFTKAQLGSIKFLFCESISDVSGLEHLSSIDDLTIQSGTVTNLKPLSGLTTLRTLYLIENKITDLSPLTGLPNLTLLDADLNPISNIAPVAKMKQLEILYLSGCKLTNIKAVAGLTNLIALEVNSNQVTDLAPVTSLTKLQYLKVAHNKVSNVAPVAGLKNLKVLDLFGNKISNVTPLASLPTTLQSLGLSANQIWDASALSRLSGTTRYVMLQTLSTSAVVGVPKTLGLKGVTGNFPTLSLPSGLRLSGTTLTATKPGTYAVNFGDGNRFGGVLTVVAKLPAVTGSTPTVSGTAKVGRTLTASPGGWQPSGVTLGYQWYRGDAKIGGATSTTYQVQPADAGAKLWVAVTGSKSGYSSTTKLSARTKLVPWLGRIKSSTPKISGTRKVGKTLNAKLGKIKPSGTSVSYQWYRGSSKIAGATTASYRTTKADKRKYLRVKVTLSKAGYPTWSKQSKKTKIR